MDNVWQQVNVISPGGTIFSMARDGDQNIWIAASAGILRRVDGAWRPLPGGQPLPQVHTLTWAGRTLVAGGTAGQIVYSTDGGSSWYQAHTATLASRCLAAYVAAVPPGQDVMGRHRGRRYFSFQGRGTLLASGQMPAGGPGHYRSGDASFKSWERRALVFAATAHGLYRSTTGGTQWRKPEGALGDMAVQAVAFSPNFARDGFALAATETGGFFCTRDRGVSWQPYGEGLAQPSDIPPVNTLWLHPDFADRPICLAGTGDGQIFRSEDGRRLGEGAFGRCFDLLHGRRWAAYLRRAPRPGAALFRG